MMTLEQVLAQWVRRTPTEEGVPAPAAQTQLSGRWTNGYGSVAEFTVDGDRVAGTYTSAVGASEGGSSITGPVTGFVRGDVVAFSVLWPAPLRSITSWVGQVVDAPAGPELRTLWQLIVDIPDAREASGLWTTVHTGADTFR